MCLFHLEIMSEEFKTVSRLESAEAPSLLGRPWEEKVSFPGVLVS